MIILFSILMIVFLFKAIGFAFRLSWNIFKIAFMIFVIPAVLIGLLFTVISSLAIPALIIIGVVMLLKEDRGANVV